MALQRPPESDVTALYRKIVGHLKQHLGPYVQTWEISDRRSPPFATTMGVRAIVTPSQGPITPTSVIATDNVLVVRVDYEVENHDSTLLVDLIEATNRVFFPGDGSMTDLLRHPRRSYKLIPLQTVHDAGDVVVGQDNRVVGRAGFTSVAVRGSIPRKT